MTLSLHCPVCGYQEVPGDICPNCDTDLSTLRLLLTLPETPTVPPPTTLSKWRTVLIVLFIALISTLMGASLAFTLGRIPEVSQASDPLPTATPTGIPETPVPIVEPTAIAVLPVDRDPVASELPDESDSDDPQLVYVLYRVESGDTLGGIASRHGIPIEEMTRINPQLQGREDQILVGESLFLSVPFLRQIPDKDTL